MNEKAEEDEFEDDDEEIVAGGEDVDVDHLFRDMEKRKRNAPKPGDPAWRKLEKYREERLTAELVSDFDDYDISGEGDLEETAGTPSATRHRKAS
ncbi:MAG TPA: hypothetical protein VK629_19915 [Steroidobacteraceae bacterium]|nr:hypothetical protein [Steroidobacteraceae bacterium]